MSSVEGIWKERDGRPKWRLIVPAVALSAILALVLLVLVSGWWAAREAKRLEALEREQLAALEEERKREDAEYLARLSPEERSDVLMHRSRHAAIQRERAEQAEADRAREEGEAKARVLRRKENERQRDLRVQAAANVIRANLRDPDSLRWRALRASEDGAVICAEYAARNGFGGMSVEETVFTPEGAFSGDSIEWIRYCYQFGMKDYAGRM